MKSEIPKPAPRSGVPVFLLIFEQKAQKQLAAGGEFWYTERTHYKNKGEMA